ncbi:MAG TPA: peptidase T [Candidatus Ligilactobacillus excrementipullorum]|nr:peptidase T [Candidatus Ligilactobacillus excrementipullorum]
MVEIDHDFIEQQFVTYCKYNSRSDARSQAVPSTPGQVKLAKRLVADLQDLGLEAWYNEKNGFAMGYLPGNSSQDITGIGFVAHLDTTDYPAENVLPQVHPDYDGQDVVLNADQGIVMHVSEFPELTKLKGQRLITSDGTTLLGSDDKAGIAGLFGALKAFIAQPKIEHGPIYVGFGPDEETGQGAKRFDASEFPVEFAYTLDNGQPGDLEYETFNATAAKIEIEGTAVHPGNAYHLLVNAATLANQFAAALPKDQVPEESQGREGFIMLTSQVSSIDHAELHLIIRDFDWELYQANIHLVEEIVAQINAQLDKPRLTLELTEQYVNMGDKIRENPYIVNLVLDSYHKLGLTPNVIAFRGGTDGDFITEKGIPTPNLFNAGGNFHGKYEYATTEGMALLAETIVTICQEHVAQNGQRNEAPLGQD